MFGLLVFYDGDILRVKLNNVEKWRFKDPHHLLFSEVVKDLSEELEHRGLIQSWWPRVPACYNSFIGASDRKDPVKTCEAIDPNWFHGICPDWDVPDTSKARQVKAASILDGIIRGDVLDYNRTPLEGPSALVALYKYLKDKDAYEGAPIRCDDTMAMMASVPSGTVLGDVGATLSLTTIYPHYNVDAMVAKVTADIAGNFDPYATIEEPAEETCEVRPAPVVSVELHPSATQEGVVPAHFYKFVTKWFSVHLRKENSVKNTVSSGIDDVVWNGSSALRAFVSDFQTPTQRRRLGVKDEDMEGTLEEVGRKAYDRLLPVIPVEWENDPDKLNLFWCLVAGRVVNRSADYTLTVRKPDLAKSFFTRKRR